MRDFVQCLLYLIIIATAAHFVGEAIPRKLMDWNRSPFAAYGWERNGKVYDSINIKGWKDHLPDMSRVMKKMVPKRVLPGMGVAEVELLIRETCVAELVHEGLIVLSTICIGMWPVRGGALIALAFSLGNLPFIIIQRYNRPKLVRLLEIMKRRKTRAGAGVQNAEIQPCENAV